jgi:leucyl-tRNA synthetase
MEYNFGEIEKKWQKFWQENKTYKCEIDKTKPKFYVLDMFPYPSGAGLHVGHPLGYIASDIYSRYKRLNGFNVLHPMGYDAYGLPAEQYAIQTGQHPAITTENNIKRYREQLDQLGFSYDWSREVRTCDPKYYKWTQWTFIQLFNSWYNKKTEKAEKIENLITGFSRNGSEGIDAACSDKIVFTAEEWNKMSEREQQETLMSYRLAYLADTMVNWCPALGTVLANDEVIDGLSARGGHPVERKPMKQWLLRITAYSERLLNGLDNIDWSDALKEIQRNWIGRSEGASVDFKIKNSNLVLNVFTTRPDTIFGVTFMTLAPEHEFVPQITTGEQKDSVEKYIIESKNRTDRERMAEVKKISGKFTGAYAVHPFTGEDIPIWIGDYVLAGYGTGAVMAVPGHDSRDYAFAKHFGLQIKEVVSGGDISVESYDAKDGILVNSDFLNGLNVKQAIIAANDKLVEACIGIRKINFRLRDAIFSRQRYWGEPFPVYYKEGIPYVLKESELPLLLPEVDTYLPTESGEPPLARAKNWVTKDGYPLETNTMPGFAGSSAYYLRYEDPNNENEYFSKEANAYWQNVDLYIGGAEHGTGHLIYARFWNKFLFDLGMTVNDEPFKKLVNQGMIQGRSSLLYFYKGTKVFISNGRIGDILTEDELNLISPSIDRSIDGRFNSQIAQNVLESTIGSSVFDSLSVLNVDINLVKNDILLIDEFKKWRTEYSNADFIKEKDGSFICSYAIEKMSKSKYNVVTPDELVEKYGADTVRLYEMFLGPLEQHKPWDTKGIEGVFRFIKKLWRLYHDNENNFLVSEEQPTAEELKVLHKTIKKIREDIERISFNTAVSAFMICINELTELKCNKRAVLKELTILISPFAPHIAEELWHLLGNSNSITMEKFPEFNEACIVEDNFNYPVSFNGKMRFNMSLPKSLKNDEIEKIVLSAPDSQKWLEGKAPKKVIIVPCKIVNIVI